MARKRKPEFAKGGIIKESSMRILHENRGDDIVSPIIKVHAPEQIRTSKRSNILDTPPPYTQSWLDQNGLRVLYIAGRAVLQFRK